MNSAAMILDVKLPIINYTWIAFEVVEGEFRCRIDARPCKNLVDSIVVGHVAEMAELLEV